MDIFWKIASFILGVSVFWWLIELILGLKDNIFDPIPEDKGPLE